MPLRVGTAGWSYEDWKGIVYPKDAPKNFDPLAYLSQYFDTIEINSSFYRPPAPHVARSWVKRVGHNPRFRFTAKLPRIFTHERGKATVKDEQEIKEGIGELAEADRLGAVLVQFPWSFKNTTEDRTYCLGLLRQFREFPLVLEVRHASWNTPQIYETLEEIGVGICNIDQPLFRRSIKPAALATSSTGYVRLHGRNYEYWFRQQSGRDERYDYLYTPEELEPWVARIREVARETPETYVITNNHFRGKAVVNAVELKALLEEQAVSAPEPLAAAYPILNQFVNPDLAT